MMKMPKPKPETRCTNAAPMHINTKNIVVSCIVFRRKVSFYENLCAKVRFFIQKTFLF